MCDVCHTPSIRLRVRFRRLVALAVSFTSGPSITPESRTVSSGPDTGSAHLERRPLPAALACGPVRAARMPASCRTLLRRRQSRRARRRRPATSPSGSATARRSPASHAAARRRSLWTIHAWSRRAPMHDPTIDRNHVKRAEQLELVLRSRHASPAQDCWSKCMTVRLRKEMNFTRCLDAFTNNTRGKVCAMRCSPVTREEKCLQCGRQYGCFSTQSILLRCFCRGGD